MFSRICIQLRVVPFACVCHCFAETVIAFEPDRESLFSGVRAQSENKGRSLMTHIGVFGLFVSFDVIKEISVKIREICGQYLFFLYPLVEAAANLFTEKNKLSLKIWLIKIIVLPLL